MHFLKYFVDEAHRSLFIPEEIDRVLKDVHRYLYERNRQHVMAVFPDVSHKDFGLPTGTALVFPEDQALLFPTILRDPGCGLLTFKLRFHDQIKTDWHLEAGPLLDELININIKNAPILKEKLNTPEKLREILNLPATCLDITEEELQLLVDDRFTLTNTVELRQIQEVPDQSHLEIADIQKQDVIGFIHSGCNIFPDILAKRFLLPIADYCVDNGLATVQDIRNKIFGIPLNTSLGQEYYQWLSAATNYAKVNRYGLYCAVKELLGTHYPCTVEIINDVIHAGVFEYENKQGKFIINSRGTQQLNNNNHLNLIAGQRESIAALVRPMNHAENYFNLLAHGTSYEVDEDYQNKYVSNDELLNAARHAYYNTSADFSKCHPYTFNLIESIKYFEKIGLVKPVAWLSPWINIHRK